VGKGRQQWCRHVDRIAEDDLKAWPTGSEVPLRRERNVDMKPTLEEEDPVERGPRADVPVVDDSSLVAEGRCPVCDDVVDVGALSDAQEDVDIGPGVLVAESGGAR
jgi:hypothetical protein